MIDDCDVASPPRVQLTAWPATKLPALVDANDAVVCCTRVPGERHAIHAVVRQILSDALTSTAPDLAYTPTGKPYLAGHNPLHPLKFNLSHCGDVLIVALSLTSEVGVDVERVRAIPEWRRIAGRIFDPATREQLFTEIAVGADERDAFLRYWCRMEATVKATGEGVFGRDTRDAANDAAAGRAQPRVIDLPDLPLPAGDARYRAALALCP
jgi:hypothetical protein